MAVEFAEWLRLLETEYLDGYIEGDGAAVKLLVAPEFDAVAETLAHVAGRAVEKGYLVAWVDSARVKVQMVDELFHSVARQVDWMADADSRADRAAQRPFDADLSDRLSAAPRL
jgi:hypothetical protein